MCIIFVMAVATQLFRTVVAPPPGPAELIEIDKKYSLMCSHFGAHQWTEKLNTDPVYKDVSAEHKVKLIEDMKVRCVWTEMFLRVPKDFTGQQFKEFLKANNAAKVIPATKEQMDKDAEAQKTVTSKWTAVKSAIAGNAFMAAVQAAGKNRPIAGIDVSNEESLTEDQVNQVIAAAKPTFEELWAQHAQREKERDKNQQVEEAQKQAHQQRTAESQNAYEEHEARMDKELYNSFWVQPEMASPYLHPFDNYKDEVRLLKVADALNIAVADCLGKKVYDKKPDPSLPYRFRQEVLRKAWGAPFATTRYFSFLTPDDILEGRLFIYCVWGGVLTDILSYSFEKLLKYRLAETTYNFSVSQIDGTGTVSVFKVNGSELGKYEWLVGSIKGQSAGAWGVKYLHDFVNEFIRKDKKYLAKGTADKSVENGMKTA